MGHELLAVGLLQGVEDRLARVQGEALAELLAGDFLVPLEGRCFARCIGSLADDVRDVDVAQGRPGAGDRRDLHLEEALRLVILDELANVFFEVLAVVLAAEHAEEPVRLVILVFSCASVAKTLPLKSIERT